MIETSPIHILLVDDHEVVRMGLRGLLERQTGFQIVGEAGTVAGAIAEAKRLQPDVVVLDVRLPDGNGFEACRQIQDLPHETKVLILTSYADDNTVVESIRAGADGYLLKDVNSNGIVDAIRRVHEGQSILDPAVTRSVLGRVRNKSTEEGAADLASLSPQERRVLSLVALGKTNKEIGVEMGLSDKTVKNYLANLMDKLNLTRRSQAAAFYVSKVGL